MKNLPMLEIKAENSDCFEKLELSRHEVAVLKVFQAFWKTPNLNYIAYR